MFDKKNINATAELIRTLREIHAIIEQLESSHNCAIVLLKCKSLAPFHDFNIYFKQVWDEFDHQSTGQLLQLYNVFTTHSILCNNYLHIFKDVLLFLEEKDDSYSIEKEGEDYWETNPPICFLEEKSTDVIGLYKEQLKKKLKGTDKEDDSLYDIGKTTGGINDTSSENLYYFISTKLNDSIFDCLFDLYESLVYVFLLMSTVCSYPRAITSDSKLLKADNIISVLENELRQYAIENGERVERDLRKIAQLLKPNRNAPLDSDAWGRVMEEEDKLFDLVLSGQLDETEEKRLEYISATREQLNTNKSLLREIKKSSDDEKLFDIRLSIENQDLRDVLTADNLKLFYELVLRQNIIHREMFPDKLSVKYYEWLNNAKEQHTSQADSEDKKARDSEESNKVKNVLDSFVSVARASSETNEKTWWYRLYAPMRELAIKEIQGIGKYKPFFTLMHQWFPKDTEGFDDGNWSGAFSEETKKWKEAKMVGHENWAQHRSKGSDGTWTDIQRNKAKTAYQVWSELNAICKEQKKR